ncbi:ABC transporter ATP-binding protein [Lachnoclostridium phytofermentans]|uniref:ABC transporter ATP-binding protein n=1 Tax=Lachnoclostridium phytofermentans TaxID=66219 RepID=UPI000495380A|nr:ABC transporter ATP-binding protein [Lachnoclostridium phytofermentans]
MQTKTKYGNMQYIKWLFFYTKDYLPKLLLLMGVDFSNTFLTVGLAVVSKYIIDSATSGESILFAIMLYIGVVFITQALYAVNGMVSVLVNEKYSFGIRKQVYDKIIHSHWMDVKKYHTGDLMTRLTSDSGNIADGMVFVLPTMVRLFLELLLTFLTLFFYEPRLALFAAMLAPVAALTSLWLGRRLKRLQIKVQETESAYRSYLQESLSNLLIVKSFANEDFASERLTELRNERLYWIKKKNRLSVLSSTVMSLTFQIGYVAAFAFGALQLSKTVITYGTMSVFLTLVNRIQAPIIGLAQNIPKIVSVIASTGRIMELQSIPLEEKHKARLIPQEISLRLKNVSFGYSEDEVLHNITLDISPGEFVAVIGESGIGKTTLVRLIMSFMKEKSGEISFFHQNGEVETSNAGVRNYISYVPQGNTLFSGKIRENIRMGRLEATDEEIEYALILSAAKEFVSELPDGLDTIIGEHGHGLSEGQAQRIAIARALVRKAPLLILDEATSSLDSDTELHVLEGIKQLSPRPTCLIITHRRSILPYCDREVCIKDKELMEIPIG